MLTHHICATPMSATTDDMTLFESRLNSLGVKTERQAHQEQYAQIHTSISTAFAMGTHARLGSGCPLLVELKSELCMIICAFASQDLCDLQWASVSASPCPISMIQDRMLAWSRMWHALNTFVEPVPDVEANIQTWACILELQRVLNRCWQKGSVVFTVPPQEERHLWWNSTSWFGWSQMRITDPHSFHDDIIVMINTQPKVWTGLYSLFNVLGRCAVYQDTRSRRLEDSEVEFATNTFLVRYEEWSFHSNSFYMHYSISD